MTTGSCVCGEVAWEVSAPLSWMTHCHCSRCRKAHGTAFGTYAAAHARAFRFTRGAASLRSFPSSPALTRTFCARCGSKLPVHWEDEVHMPAGTLDGELGVRPSRHLFVASKAPWHTIHGLLPQEPGSASPSDPELADARVTDPAAGRVRGGCLCGAVAFEMDGPLTGGGITSCHCSRCRKARGSAHGSNLFVGLAHFRWLRGEDRLRSYKIPEAARYTQVFCGACGSPQPNASPARGAAVVPCGSLEDDPGVREQRHIFVSSKAAWFDIAGELPQFAEYPPPPFPELSVPARS
jgi:hypothetical protein